MKQRSAYDLAKGLAYSVLSTMASCDHGKAKSKGYKDGWAMILDLHDEPEMVAFGIGLMQLMDEPRRQILLDGLVAEYTEFKDYLSYAEACVAYPDWKPSQGTVAQYLARKSGVDGSHARTAASA